MELSNGQVCNPLYGSSCTYCSTSCKIITLNGPYCGDGTCNVIMVKHVQLAQQIVELCSVCGNGIKEGTEQCDDHNTANNDGCSSTCKLEACGDGIKQTHEQCDNAYQW